MMQVYDVDTLNKLVKEYLRLQLHKRIVKNRYSAHKIHCILNGKEIITNSMREFYILYYLIYDLGYKSDDIEYEQLIKIEDGSKFYIQPDFYIRSEDRYIEFHPMPNDGKYTYYTNKFKELGKKLEWWTEKDYNKRIVEYLDRDLVSSPGFLFNFDTKEYKIRAINPELLASVIHDGNIDISKLDVDSDDPDKINYWIRVAVRLYRYKYKKLRIKDSSFGFMVWMWHHRNYTHRELRANFGIGNTFQFYKFCKILEGIGIHCQLVRIRRSRLKK